MAGYVPGLVAETEEDKKTGILDRIAGGINKAYSDPARARGLTQMGMALMDAAGPRPLGQQLNTGQILARGMAGYHQGADQYRQQQLAEQEAMLKRAAMLQQAQGDTSKMESERFDRETKLRDRFRSDNKDLFSITEAGQRIIDSARDPSAAGDLALIFNYMKMLDPGSTVREGEFANAQNASGIPGRIVSLYNNILEGTRLNPDQRLDFVSRAADLYQGTQSILGQRSKKYAGLAEQYNLNPENVVFMDDPLDFESVLSPPQTTAAPQAPQAPKSPQQRKTINGDNYVMVDGQWFKEE